MRTCPKVRVTAHCERLCLRNGEATAGLTELTINNSNNMYWYAYSTDTCITKNLENTVALIRSPRLFLLESQSKQQHEFVTGKVKLCNPFCLKPSS